MNMHIRPKTVFVLLALLAMSSSLAQTVVSDDGSESEQLKVAALEALMSAPPERALPLVTKVLNGNHSEEVKSRALFVLSQIDLPEAQAQLLDVARSGDGELRGEAVRMIGISGNAEALAELADLYTTGNEDVRDAVLEAYMIAGDDAAVFQIAANATDPEEFEAAVEMLGVMGATDELRALRESSSFSEILIEAFAISGDFETLRELALDGSDPELQGRAIEALGIVGGENVNTTLMEIYRSADSADIREAALDGLLISGHDEGVLELYKASDNINDKRALLEALTIMGSDLVLDVIDEALAGDR
jgi:HEAT repeat protein